MPSYQRQLQDSRVNHERRYQPTCTIATSLISASAPILNTMQYQPISNYQRSADLASTQIRAPIPLTAFLLSLRTPFLDPHLYGSYPTASRSSPPWSSADLNIHASTSAALAYPTLPIGVPLKAADVAEVVEEEEKRTPRPPNAFILYRTERSRLLRKHGAPKRPQSEISKLVGHMWRTETPEVRAEWEEKAREVKAKHLLQYPEYRFKPLRKSSLKNAVSQGANTALPCRKSFGPHPYRQPLSLLGSSSEQPPQLRRTVSGPYDNYRETSSTDTSRRSSTTGLVDDNRFPVSSWNATSYSAHSTFQPNQDDYFAASDSYSFPGSANPLAYVPYPALHPLPEPQSSLLLPVQLQSPYHYFPINELPLPFSSLAPQHQQWESSAPSSPASSSQSFYDYDPIAMTSIAPSSTHSGTSSFPTLESCSMRDFEQWR